MNEHKKQLLLKYYQLKSFYKRLGVIKKALQVKQKSAFKYLATDKNTNFNIDHIVRRKNMAELMDINNTLWISTKSIYGYRYNIYGRYLNKYCLNKDGDASHVPLDKVDGTNLLKFAIENKIQPIVLMRNILALKKKVKDKFSCFEIEKLKELVGEHGNNWVLISKYLDKTPQQCLQCYKKLVKKNAGRWSSKEDELLLQAVQKHGTKWMIVSEHIGTRNDMQCRERYVNVLSVARKEWTEGDDKQLVELVGKFGRRWKIIGDLMARNNKECRRRYFKIATEG